MPFRDAWIIVGLLLVSIGFGTGEPAVAGVGFVVVLVCCNIGLNTRGGPREIGASVTRAVVTSLILILVLDYFVTKALM